MDTDGTLYLGQGGDVYSVAPGTTTMRRASGVPATAAPAATDGSVYVADPSGSAIWRQWPDGTATVALGRHPDSPDAAPDVTPSTPPIGFDLATRSSAVPVLEPLPDGRLVVADDADARVHLVRPGGGRWAEPGPTMTATTTTTVKSMTGTVEVHVALPADGPAWHLRVMAAPEAADPSPTQGYTLATKTLEPGGTGHLRLTRKGPDNWVGWTKDDGTTWIRPGDRFTLRLWAWVGDGGVAARPVTVTAEVPRIPAALTIAAPVERAYGVETLLTGRLSTPDAAAAGISQQSVELQRRDPGGEWKRLAVVDTAWNGTFFHRFRPTRPQEYRAVHAAHWAEAAVSATRVINVRYAVSTTRSALSARRGERLWLTGTVRPGARGDEVILQRRVYRAGAWTWRTLNRARLDSNRGYILSAPVPSDVPANHHAFYRVLRPAGDGLRAGSSVTIHVTVRAGD